LKGLSITIEDFVNFFGRNPSCSEFLFPPIVAGVDIVVTLQSINKTISHVDTLFLGAPLEVTCDPQKMLYAH